MPKYAVRAYRANGALAFGATLNCPDTETAVARFQALPLNGLGAELLRGQRVVALREALTRQQPAAAARKQA